MSRGVGTDGATSVAVSTPHTELVCAHAASGAIECPEQTVADHLRAIQVLPGPAHDLPATVSERILAELLAIDGVFTCLALSQQPAVLDLAVELAEGPLLLPPEIAAGHQRTAFVVHRELDLRSRDPLLDEAHSANRLTGALGARVEQIATVPCPTHARPALHRCQPPRELGWIEPDLERAVPSGNGLVQRERTREVQHGATQGRRHDPVDHLEVCRRERRRMDVHDA